jgi:hypothetical protein
LDDAYNPLTFATYGAKVDVRLLWAENMTTSGVSQSTFVVYGLDSADNIVASNVVRAKVSITNANTPEAVFSAGVVSTTAPISRVIVYYALQEGDIPDTLSANSTAVITAYEETADVPGRPVHVCVFEGLNSTATINIASAATMSGIPDSTNVFIGSTGKATPEVYDDNAVTMFLKSVARVVPRAYTIAGLNSVEREVTALYGDKEVTVAFQALSFRKIMRGIRSIAKVAKVPAKEISSYVIRPIEEKAREIASVLDYVPGPRAAIAAQALRVGSDMSSSLRGGDIRGAYDHSARNHQREIGERKLESTRNMGRQIGL